MQLEPPRPRIKTADLGNRVRNRAPDPDALPRLARASQSAVPLKHVGMGHRAEATLRTTRRDSR
eukprot:354394-Rhodomonas_salina.1